MAEMKLDRPVFNRELSQGLVDLAKTPCLHNGARRGLGVGSRIVLSGTSEAIPVPALSHALCDSERLKKVDSGPVITARASSLDSGTLIRSR